MRNVLLKLHFTEKEKTGFFSNTACCDKYNMKKT